MVFFVTSNEFQSIFKVSLKMRGNQEIFSRSSQSGWPEVNDFFTNYQA